MRMLSPTLRIVIALLFTSVIIVPSYAFALPNSESSKPSSPMSSDATNNDKLQKQNAEEQQEESSTSTSIPQIGPADPNDTSIPTLKLGETVRLEELGPIIINTDGTTRRIDNWDTLSEREREVTWRRIQKRNAERRKILEEQLGKE